MTKTNYILGVDFNNVFHRMGWQANCIAWMFVLMLHGFFLSAFLMALSGFAVFWVPWTDEVDE